MKISLLLPIFFLIPGFIGLQSQTYNDSLPPGNNYQQAAFRLWLPDTIDKVWGITVLVPGSNGDGRNLVNDPAWKAFAEQNQLALLGCYYTDSNHPEPEIEHYVRANDGSGQALLDILMRLAVQSGHPELADAPLLLWGHSAGGQFNYEFACWKPDRVIAFVVNKGGIYFTAIASPETRRVPGIFFTGEKDLEYRSDIIKGIFAANRRFGALWALAVEPGAGHEIGKTQEFAIQYFTELLPLRLDALPVAKATIPPVRELIEASGFIGDPKTHEVTSYPQWTKTRYPTAWLPSRSLAEKWVSFVTGKIE